MNSPYWTGTSLQLRPVRGVFSNAKHIYLFLTTFPRMSLHCKLVPVQYRGYEYGLSSGGVRHKFQPIGKLHLNNSLRGKEQCASEGRLLKKNLFPAACCDSCENRLSENEDSYIYIILAVLNYCIRASCMFYKLPKLMWLARPPCCYISEFHTFLFARRSLFWSL